MEGLDHRNPDDADEQEFPTSGDQTPDAVSNDSKAEAFEKKEKRRERRNLRLNAGRNKPNEPEDDSRLLSTPSKMLTGVCNSTPILKE